MIHCLLLMFVNVSTNFVKMCFLRLPPNLDRKVCNKQSEYYCPTRQSIFPSYCTKNTSPERRKGYQYTDAAGSFSTSSLQRANYIRARFNNLWILEDGRDATVVIVDHRDTKGI